MKLYPQTQFVIASIILLAIVLLSRKNLNSKKRVHIIITLLIAVTPSLYSINCLISGKCVVWAWYNAILLSVWCISASLISIKN